MAKKPKKPVAPPVVPQTELTASKRRPHIAAAGAATRFAPGNAGRPKGARNKLGDAFLEAMHEDFKINGKSAIVNCRILKPDVYVRVCADLLRKEIVISREDEVFDNVSDSELDALLAESIARSRAIAGRIAAEESAAGTAAAARKGKPGRVH